MCERESPNNSSNVQQKGKKKIDDAPKMPNLSVGYDDVDGHLSGFDNSLDMEFGIPSMKMPSVKKDLEGLNEKLRKSASFKKRVQCLLYDSYVGRHYAYIAKIV